MEKKNCELCQEPLSGDNTWYDLDCRHRILLCSEECNQALELLLKRRKKVTEDLQRYRDQLVASVRSRRRRSVRLDVMREQLEKIYESS